MVTVTFRLTDKNEAKVHLKFLRCVSFPAVAKTLDGQEKVRVFNKASERLRVALRQVVEPERG
jgi:hypothetical protein